MNIQIVTIKKDYKLNLNSFDFCRIRYNFVLDKTPTMQMAEKV
jgi:hypothetical protein